MSKTAMLAVKIIGDATKAVAEFDKFGRTLKRWDSKVTSAAKKMSIVSAGVIAFGKSSIDAASNLEQSMGAVNSVFKESANQMLQWSNQAAVAVGLSKNEYNEFASVIGSQLKNLGIPMEELGTKTNDLIKLGADLASMYGGTTSDAVTALSAVFRGETDPIERYGVSIKQSDVNARMAAEGLDKLEGEARKQAEANVRMKMVMEQSKDALGNFARETDTVAHKQQVAAAEFENAKATIGEALLPVVAQVADKFAELAQWIGENRDEVIFWGSIILGVTGTLWAIHGAIIGVMTAVQVIGGILGIINAIIEATWLWEAAQAALNFVFVANPIGAVIALVVVLGVAIYTLYNNSETFRNAVHAVWDTAVNAFNAIVGWVKNLINRFIEAKDKAGGFGNLVKDVFSRAVSAALSFINPINTIIGLIGALIGKISGIRFPSPPAWISKFLSAGNPDLTGVPDSSTMFRFYPTAPELTAAAPIAPNAFRSFNTQSTRPVVNVDRSVNINVDGAGIVDPRAVADSIRTALRQDNRLRGLSVASQGGKATWQ